MDVFLSADAERSLRAASRLARAAVRGYLVGHFRGPRCFVEAAIPAPGIRAFSYEDVRILDRLYGGRTVGFFVIGDGAAAGKTRLEPYACGRVFLDVKGGPGTRIKAYAVDYDRRIVLSPVPAVRPRERGKP